MSFATSPGSDGVGIIKKLVKQYFSIRPSTLQLLDFATKEMQRYEQAEERISTHHSSLIEKNRQAERRERTMLAGGDFANKKAATLEEMLAAVKANKQNNNVSDDDCESDGGEWQVATGGSTRAAMKRILKPHQDSDPEEEIEGGAKRLLSINHDGKDGDEEEADEAAVEDVKRKKRRGMSATYPQLYKKCSEKSRSKKAAEELRQAFEQKDRPRLAALMRKSSNN